MGLQTARERGGQRGCHAGGGGEGVPQDKWDLLDKVVGCGWGLAAAALAHEFICSVGAAAVSFLLSLSVRGDVIVPASQPLPRAHWDSQAVACVVLFRCRARGCKPRLPRGGAGLRRANTSAVAVGRSAVAVPAGGGDAVVVAVVVVVVPTLAAAEVADRGGRGRSSGGSTSPLRVALRGGGGGGVDIKDLALWEVRDVAGADDGGRLQVGGGQGTWQAGWWVGMHQQGFSMLILLVLEAMAHRVGRQAHAERRGPLRGGATMPTANY